MALRYKVEHNNLSSGELSPWLRNRTNLDRYQNGVKVMRNFVCIPEGGSTRRGGTRFVLPLKTENQVGILIPFRYSGVDTYMLVLNGGAIRFLRAGGFILSGPSPYEVAVPWGSSDLANVRWAQEGNAAWLPCPGFEPRKLVRGTSHTDWTLSLYRPTGGPVKIQNLDTSKTILAAARTGTGITLIGVGTNFQAGHVGSVWRLDESDLSLIANWKANEAITIPTEVVPNVGSAFGTMVPASAAYDNNSATACDLNGASGYVGFSNSVASTIFSVNVTCQYQPGVAGTPFSTNMELYGKVGAPPASATDGTLLGVVTASVQSAPNITAVGITSNNSNTVFDHHWVRYVENSFLGNFRVFDVSRIRFTAGGTPVLRRYNGNVYQAISGTNSGLAPPTHTEGDVLSETGGVVWRFRNGPYGFVRFTSVASLTSATADVIKPLPDSVTSRGTYRWWEGAWNSIDGWPEGVLLVDRGLFFWRGKDFWMTTVDNDNDFDVTVLEDSAVSQSLRSRDGSLPLITWALDNGVIVLGCRDNEVILRAPGTFDPLTSLNVRAPVGSKKGSAVHVPAALEDGAVFIGRSRKRLFFASFDPDTQKLQPTEVSIGGRHLLAGKAAGLGWQPDPWNVLWGYCQDGSLFGVTLNQEHKIVAMHSHPLVNGLVRDVKSIPSSDEGVSDVYMIVERVINGATRRYVEQLGPYFDNVTGDATGAWFFDCALAYSGAATGVISGLSHLVGQTVGIIANNAAHARKVVSAGGTVTLDRTDTTTALVGIPIDARVRDLPRNISLQTGNTKGSKKRAAHCVVDVVDTIGGTISCNDGKPEALELTGGAAYGVAPKLFTGAKRKQIVAPLKDEAEVEIVASDGMPFTLTGLMPEIEVTED